MTGGMLRHPALMLAFALLAAPAAARDALGMFGQWGAFRDAGQSANGSRCYAIAMPAHGTGGARNFTPYADVGTWPKRGLSGVVHFRLPRAAAPGSAVTLTIGDQHFALANGGAEAWAADAQMDAAIVAAMRSATGMTIAAHDAAGKGFSESWDLAGAATAIDSALVGCANHG